MDLGGVGAVKNAIEFGVFERKVEGIYILGFFGGDLLVGLESVFARIGAGNISRKLARSTSKYTRKGNTNSAKFGGFEGFVIRCEGAVEVSRADVKLLNKVARFGGFIAQHRSKTKDKDEEH